MKKLWVVRHAKSSWDSAGLQDAKRPLLEKGIERTKRIITYLRRYQDRPELILSSQAVRAYETAKIFAIGLDYPVEKISVEPDIYYGAEDQFWSILFAIPNNIQHAMVVGHNPTITRIVNSFLSEKMDYFPTSALLGLTFETDKWEEIANAKFTIEHILMPKKLMGNKD